MYVFHGSGVSRQYVYFAGKQLPSLFKAKTRALFSKASSGIALAKYAFR
jgi:hypothetical protein